MSLYPVLLYLVTSSPEHVLKLSVVTCQGDMHINSSDLYHFKVQFSFKKTVIGFLKHILKINFIYKKIQVF